MLDKLNKLEEGQTLFDEELNELYDVIDKYMKGCYLFSDSGSYNFKLKGKCFEIHESFAQDRTCYVKRTSKVTVEECIDLEDIVKGIIKDTELRERKEKLDALRAMVRGLEESGISRTLINNCISNAK